MSQSKAQSQVQYVNEMMRQATHWADGAEDRGASLAVVTAINGLTSAVLALLEEIST